MNKRQGEGGGADEEAEARLGLKMRWGLFAPVLLHCDVCAEFDSTTKVSVSSALKLDD